MDIDPRRIRKTTFLSLVAVFGSISVILDSLMILPEVSSGIWYSWIFIVEPINGIFLGPYMGSLSSLIGVMIGHSIYFRDIYEFLFTLGAPIGTMIAGFLFKGKWKIPLIYYTLLLGAYFITPIAWQLPVLGIWDILLAYAILFAVVIMMFKKGSWDMSKTSWQIAAISLSALIGLEADILFRIFIFIPCQTYRLFYGLSLGTLIPIWIEAAAITPIKVAISIFFSISIGPPLINVIEKTGFFKKT